MPAVTVPLLSDHKTLFVWNRLLETFFGGVRFYIGTGAPAFVYVFQFFIHQLPALVGSVFTVFCETSILSPITAASCGGVTMMSLIGAIQITSHILQRGRSPVVQVQIKQNPHLASVLREEDAVDFKSCCSSDTLSYLLLKKKFVVNSVLHSVFGGLLTGYGVVYLAPRRLQELFSNSGVIYVVFIMGWMTLCIAMYSLTVRAPQETATFQLLDHWEILPLMRPFYVALCYAFDVVVWQSSVLNRLNAVVHLLFIFLPLMWFLNLFPPLDALLLWFLEQIQMWLAGGSPTISLSGLLFQLCLWCLSVVAMFFMPLHSTLLAAALLGYCLSLDLNFLWYTFISNIRLKQKRKNSVAAAPQTVIASWNWKDLIYFFITFIMVLVLALGLRFGLSEAASNINVISSLGWILVVKLLISWAGSSLQMVYIFGGLIRNNLYPLHTRQESKFMARQHLLSNLGKIRDVIINIVTPFILITYVTILQTARLLRPQSSHCQMLWYSIATLRAFRWSWLQTESALVEFTIVHFVMAYTPISQFIEDAAVLLLIVALICDRISNFIAKFHTYVILLLTSVLHEKQRRPYSCCLFGCNIIFFPLSLFIILFSSLISAPLMPLFTLPIFWMGFPRPISFWPGKDTSFDGISDDSIYYEEIIPELVKKLSRLISIGSLGAVRPGDDYLMRFDDRLLWLSVLEKGNSYCRVLIKGLELQQTSCHAVEATAIDSILQWSFENEETFRSTYCCQLNRMPFHVFSPLNTVFVETYVDTRNVLTGLITSTETLQLISDCFPKCLIWVMLHHFISRQQPCQSTAAREAKSEKQISEKGHLSVNHHISSVNNDITSPLEVKRLQSRPSTAERYAQLPKVVHDSTSVSSDPLDDPWLDEDDPLDSDPPQLEKKHTIQLQSFMGISDESDTIAAATISLSTNHLPGSVNDTMDDKPLPWQKVDNHGGIREKLHRNSIDGHDETKVVGFPKEWFSSPVSKELLNSFESSFPLKWYECVVGDICNTSDRKNGDTVGEMSFDSKEMLHSVRRLVLTCHCIINQVTVVGKQIPLSPNLVNRLFNCELPWTPLSDWLLQIPELFNLVIKAFRYACKVAFDQVLLGDAQSDTEFADYLREYDQMWFIGVDSNHDWGEAVKRHVPNLFSLGYNPSLGTYTSHLLTRHLVPVYVGCLNREAVRAIWSSLNFELLYLTNDDEERYSIQAHSGLLRNLTVQGANPPLGYPVFISQPVLIKTVPLRP